jgi:hypothetical protein
MPTELLTPEQIELYIALAKSLGGAFVDLIKKLHKAGVDPAQLLAISADYDARIAIAEAEAAPPSDPPVSPV